MHTQQQYDQWQRLYTYVDNAPLNYPVEEWYASPTRNANLFFPMQIWPVMKSQILLRAVNYFHAETGPERVLIPEEIRHAHGSSFLTPSGLKPTPSTESPVLGPRTTLMEFRARLKNIGRSRILSTWPQHHSDILFFGSGMCNYSVGPYKVQNHIDPMRLALEQEGYRTSTFLLDVPAGDPALKQAFLGGTYAFEKEFTEARTVYANGGLFDFETLPEFPEFLGGMKEIFDIESILTRGIVSKTIRQTVSAYQIFRDFLRQQNVKAVFTYCYYGIAGHALAHACREVGIPFIDVQHGVAGQGHESYSWPSAPLNGYSTLPSHFLTWTEQEADFVNQNSVGEFPLAINTGHSWRLTESMLNSVGSIYPLVNADRMHDVRSIFEKLNNTTAQSFERKGGRIKNVLIATYPNEPLGWLPKVIRKAPKNWQFFLRLHPGEALDSNKVDQREKTFGRLGVSVSIPTRLPIPALMPHMDIVINKYSSIVRDAAAYGVPSLCYSLSSKWYHSPEIYESVHVVDHTAQDIYAAMKSILGKDRETFTLPPSQDMQTLGRTLKKIVQSHEA